MKEFIEKLIGRLEEISVENTCSDCPYKAKCDEVQEHINDETTDLCGATIKALSIEIVNQLAEEYINCSTDTSTNTSTNTSSGWIPCSDKLPEIDGNTSDVVIVCAIDGFQHMAFWCDDEKWRYCESGMIKNTMGWTEILAWQPLPEPYKPKGE